MYLIIAAVVAVTLVVEFVWRELHMSKLARNHIPGPEPHLIYGNLLEWRGSERLTKEKEWVQKYGKIVGFYMGDRPTVLVADADLAKSIQIKDFHQFTDRPSPSLKHLIHPVPASSTSLTRSSGKRWKEMRTALTPTFSTAKLKMMTPLIDNAINNFIEIIDQRSESGKEFDIYDMFQNLTTDVIARTAFGIQTNVQKENSKFLDAAKAIFNLKVNVFIVLIVECFPWLDTFLYPIRGLREIILNSMEKSPNGLLYDMARKIMLYRKANPNRNGKDLLQLMLDTQMSGEEMSSMTNETLTAANDGDVATNASHVYKSGAKSSKKKIVFTDGEIIANCVLFYKAGYETTSTALGYMAHILVNYPDVQERIRQEVTDLYETDGKLDFNTVSKLEYMERVLNETMRIYPPVTGFVNRKALADYDYNDITIPKGSVVMVAIHHIHHDPDYWLEPEKFDPERFSSERKQEIYPSSWQPFGSGPRNCIALRFALFEVKLALAKLLIKYRLEAGPKTEIGKLATDTKFITMTPKNGVFVKAVKL